MQPTRLGALVLSVEWRSKIDSPSAMLPDESAEIQNVRSRPRAVTRATRSLRLDLG